MAKTITGKRVKFGLEFYRRGKKKTPSVSIWDDNGEDVFGLPEELPEFDTFQKSARELCAALVKSGQLD